VGPFGAAGLAGLYIIFLVGVGDLGRWQGMGKSWDEHLIIFGGLTVKICGP
jgi:hypothetical protein